MKILKRSATIALLFFVGATVGVLIVQEVSHTDAVSSDGEPSVSTIPSDESATDTSSSDDAVPSVEETSSTEGNHSPVLDAEDTDAGTSSPETNMQETASACVVDAIYFHNTARCHTCKTIEETARTILENEFADEFGIGQLRWSAINMEQQREYIERFDLVKPTLVLVRSVENEQTDWVALDETWNLIRSSVRFRDYIESSVRSFLEVCP